MTQKQKNYKMALIKSIHSSEMYKSVYANDRELYETMLESRFSVKSSKDMGIEELVVLNDFMQGKGELKVVPDKVLATKNQVSFIKTIWKQNSREKDLVSLLKMIKRVVKKDLKSVEELTKKEAGRVIASIKGIKKLTPANN